MGVIVGHILICLQKYLLSFSFLPVGVLVHLSRRAVVDSNILLCGCGVLKFHKLHIGYAQYFHLAVSVSGS